MTIVTDGTLECLIRGRTSAAAGPAVACATASPMGVALEAVT